MAAASHPKPTSSAEEAEEEPLIVQVSAARPSGCAKCWTPTETPHRSTSSAAKNPKRAIAAKQDEPPVGANEFVYQTCGVDCDRRFSADGRHMYAFTGNDRLLVVDLFQSTQKIFKAPNGWKKEVIDAFVPVNSHTILVLSTIWRGGYYDVELELLRLDDRGDVFEAVLLERTRNAPLRTFVFAEISGQTDVKRTILGRYGALHFCRLHVDEGRMETFHSTPTDHFPRVNEGDEPAVSFHVSLDGEELCRLQSDDPNILHMYSQKDHKWATTPIETGDWNSDDPLVEFFWSTGIVYAKGRSGVLFRCELDEKKWKRMPIGGQDVAFLSPLHNPTDGTENGLLVVKMQKLSNSERREKRYRYKIQRHALRNVDSLKILAIAAVRKSREGVGGDEAFHAKMAVRPYKSLLPSLFADMKPIPVRCRRCCDYSKFLNLLGLYH